MAENRTGSSTPRAFRSRLSTRMWQLRRLLGHQFYRSGETVEYFLVRFGRGTRLSAAFVLGRSIRFGRTFLFPVGRFFRDIADDITAPFRRVYRGAGNIRALMADEKQNGRAHAFGMGVRYLGRGIRRYAYLARNFVYLLLPIGAGFLFWYTVTNVLSTQYALAVTLNDKLLGYVSEESVYENAVRSVEDQIIYAGSNENKVSLDPSVTFTAASKDQLVDSEVMADSILRNSGESIEEATGLYVNGTFYGAVTDGSTLQKAIDSIKQPYIDANPDASSVEFVQSLELRSGIYLSSNLVTSDSLVSMLNSQVQGTSTYTVVSGDTPLSISEQFGVSLDQLYAWNPSMDGGNNLHIGDVLTIGQAVSFLQVKVVKTVTEQAEIAYTTVTTDDLNMAYGSTKVTQVGQDGLSQTTYQYTYVNGEQTSKVAVGDTVIVTAPVEEHISVGKYVSISGVAVSVSEAPSALGMIFPIGSGFRGISQWFTGIYGHTGIDFYGNYATPLYAAASGTVVYTSTVDNGGYGIYLVIDHGGGVQTLYGHCSSLAVSLGDYVSQGQLVAYMGSTGWSTGNHCHFEVRINGVQVDPAPYVGLG